MARGDSEMGELAESIAKRSISGDVENVMRFVAGTPNDRNYLKLLSEMILDKLIRESASGIPRQKEIFEMIDELHGLIKIFENNININLLKCRIMASLTN